MDNDLKHPYCIMNANGFVIEKNEGFNTNINGHISDLLQKSKKILKSDNINSIEILFENKSILIKDDTVKNYNITMLVNDK